MSNKAWNYATEIIGYYRYYQNTQKLDVSFEMRQCAKPHSVLPLRGSEPVQTLWGLWFGEVLTDRDGRVTAACEHSFASWSFFVMFAFDARVTAHPLFQVGNSVGFRWNNCQLKEWHFKLGTVQVWAYIVFFSLFSSLFSLGTEKS